MTGKLPLQSQCRGAPSLAAARTFEYRVSSLSSNNLPAHLTRLQQPSPAQDHLVLTSLAMGVYFIKRILRCVRKFCTDSMLLQATIIRNYFVKTQTSVASFSPPDLSIIFSNGMYLEVSPL